MAEDYLPVITGVNPVDLFRDEGKMNAILAQIEEYCDKEVLDVDTDGGRDRVRSLAYKVARTKSLIDNAGKDMGDEARKQLDGINARRRIAKDRLEALQTKVRQPLTAWEDAEKRRKEMIEGILTHTFDPSRVNAAMDPTAIRAIMDQVESIIVSEAEWGEMCSLGAAKKVEFLTAAEEALDAAVTAEEERQELEKLRREKAEREEAERQAEEARRAAEEERLRQERIAEAEARAKAEAEERHQRELKAAEERAAHEAEAAAQRERDRIAAEKAAEEAAAAKRAENKRRRAKVRADIVKDLIATITDDGRDAAGLTKLQVEAIAGDVADALMAGTITHAGVTF